METSLGIFAGIVLVLLIGAVYMKRRGDMALEQLRASKRERDQVKQDTQDLTARWQIVTQNIDEAVILLDDAGRIVFFNDAAQGLLGSSVSVGQTFSDLGWQLQIQPLIRQVLERHADSFAQTVVKDERAFQVSVRAAPPETTVAVLIVLGEITELQRLGRVRRDFVANISHELRTPVTSLQLLAETLANELPTDLPIANDLVAKLRGQIDVLRQLTDEMMDLALVESGQLPIELVETDVQELVTSVLDVLSPQAERKQIALKVQIEQNLQVLADPAAIRKVLSNLIHNAIKFTPEKGSIVVSVYPRNDFVEFSIADNGIGIPTRDLPRIFERFYKVDRARVQTGTRGTGLGLAIAKHIVEGHGGSIRAKSGEGQGSTFYFTLPSMNI